MICSTSVKTPVVFAAPKITLPSQTVRKSLQEFQLARWGTINLDAGSNTRQQFPVPGWDMTVEVGPLAGIHFFFAKILQRMGEASFANANFTRKHGVFWMVLEMVKIPMGFWDGHFSQPPEALRQVPLDGTASLVGAIPMRPLTLQGGWQVKWQKHQALSVFFFSEKSQKLGALQPFVQYIYPWTVEFTTTWISIALKSSDAPLVAGCRISITMESVQLPGRKKCGRVSGGKTR